MHLVKIKKVIKNNILDIANTEIIHESKLPLLNTFSKFKNFNLRNDIYINNNKIDYCNFFKNMGYVPDKPNHYSSSMGFKAIIMLKLLYPNARFYLIGFENFEKKIINCHNYKYEMEYLKKNNIQHLYL